MTYSDVGGSFEPVIPPAPRFDTSDEVALAWEVRPDSVDFDQLGRAVIRATVAQAAASPTQRRRRLVAYAVLVLMGVLAALSSMSLFVGFLVYAVLIALAVRALRARAGRMAAENMRKGPFRNPHAVRIGPGGWYGSDGSSWSGSQAWSQFKWVGRDGDLVLMQAIGGAFYVLPGRALVSGPPPEDVVRIIRAWMDAAGAPQQ